MADAGKVEPVSAFKLPANTEIYGEFSASGSKCQEFCRIKPADAIPRRKQASKPRGLQRNSRNKSTANYCEGARNIFQRTENYNGVSLAKSADDVFGKDRLVAEQIVTQLRQIEMMQGQGKGIAAGCKEAGITQQS